MGEISIEYSFIITGRGLVLAGKVLEGIVEINDYLLFKLEEKVYKLKITGINSIRKLDYEGRPFTINGTMGTSF